MLSFCPPVCSSLMGRVLSRKVRPRVQRNHGGSFLPSAPFHQAEEFGATFPFPLCRRWTPQSCQTYR